MTPLKLTSFAGLTTTSWQFTDHVCRHCMGRVMTNGAVHVCANCEHQHAGDIDELCCCGITNKRSGKDQGIRCLRLENPVPGMPSKVVATQIQ